MVTSHRHLLSWLVLRMGWDVLKAATNSPWDVDGLEQQLVS